MSHRQWCCDISCDKELDHNYLNEDRVNYSGNLKFFQFEWGSAEYVVMFCQFDVTLEIAMEISWQHLLSSGSSAWALRWGNWDGTCGWEEGAALVSGEQGKATRSAPSWCLVAFRKQGKQLLATAPSVLVVLWGQGCVRVLIYQYRETFFLLRTLRKQRRLHFRLVLFLGDFPLFLLVS